MTMETECVASGPGWELNDYRCGAGPEDRPFEERHAVVSLSIVTEGTFRYRTATGSALMAPGTILLGSVGTCYECGHEHGVGDRCLSLQFEAEAWEDVVAATPGARRLDFAVPALPPLDALLGPSVGLQVFRTARETGAVEEGVLDFAGAVLGSLADAKPVSPEPTPHDRRRIATIVRRLEETAHDAADGELSLHRLAGEAGMSPYHFLRTFRRVVGMTPYQFVLRLRMNQAALRLRASDEPVAAIAFDAGFGDLSTFNRRFRRLMGSTPSAWRRTGR